MTTNPPHDPKAFHDNKVGEGLHRTYLSLTGYPERAVPCHQGRLGAWEHWYALGYRAEDLIIVIRWIKRMNKERFIRNPMSDAFNVLICNTDTFGERLGMALKERRQEHYDDGRGEILRATGRESEPIHQEAESAATILARQEALKSWAAMKQANGFK